MRGVTDPRSTLFSDVSLEEHIPRDHALRKMRILVDAVLAVSQPGSLRLAQCVQRRPRDRVNR